MELLVVNRYVVQPRHGNFYCHGSTRYINTPEGVRAGRTIGRTFRCVCGEALLEGDPIIQEAYDKRGKLVHDHCEALLCIA